MATDRQASFEILHERLECCHYPQEKRTFTTPDHVLERWQGAVENLHTSPGSRALQIMTFVKRRPVTCLFLSTVLMTTWLPLLLFALFIGCAFTVVFFSFVIFESCLIGAGLVSLLIFLTVPLCFSLAASICLLVLHWAFTYIQEHIQGIIEYSKAALIVYVTFYAPKAVRRAIGL